MPHGFILCFPFLHWYSWTTTKCLPKYTPKVGKHTPDFLFSSQVAIYTGMKMRYDANEPALHSSNTRPVPTIDFNLVFSSPEKRVCFEQSRAFIPTKWSYLGMAVVKIRLRIVCICRWAQMQVAFIKQWLSSRSFCFTFQQTVNVTVISVT